MGYKRVKTFLWFKQIEIEQLGEENLISAGNTVIFKGYNLKYSCPWHWTNILIILKYYKHFLL